MPTIRQSLSPQASSSQQRKYFPFTCTPMAEVYFRVYTIICLIVTFPSSISELSPGGDLVFKKYYHTSGLHYLGISWKGLLRRKMSTAGLILWLYRYL